MKAVRLGIQGDPLGGAKFREERLQLLYRIDHGREYKEMASSQKEKVRRMDV